MKRTLTNNSSTGAQAKVIRDIFRDAANARRSANASGGQSNSEIDKLRAINAELLAALQETTRCLAFVLKGEDSRPALWNIPGSVLRAEAIDKARALLAKVRS